MMATGGGVHTVLATATKRIEFFFSIFHCRCRHSVNEPLEFVYIAAKAKTTSLPDRFIENAI